LGGDGKEGKDGEEEESHSLLPFPFLSLLPVRSPKIQGDGRKKVTRGRGMGVEDRR